jgi:hypothetical protein
MTKYSCQRHAYIPTSFAKLKITLLNKREKERKREKDSTIS